MTIGKRDLKRLRFIKANMAFRGFNTTSLAKELGISREHLSRILNGRLESERIKRAVATALGRTYEFLWIDDPFGGDK